MVVSTATTSVKKTNKGSTARLQAISNVLFHRGSARRNAGHENCPPLWMPFTLIEISSFASGAFSPIGEITARRSKPQPLRIDFHAAGMGPSSVVLNGEPLL